MRLPGHSFPLRTLISFLYIKNESSSIIYISRVHIFFYAYPYKLIIKAPSFLTFQSLRGTIPFIMIGNNSVDPDQMASSEAS